MSKTMGLLRCLLDSDMPLELPLEDLDRALGRSTQVPQSSGPYLGYFPMVREELLRILENPKRPMSVRLACLMAAAERLSGYFDENTPRVNKAELLADLRRDVRLPESVASEWSGRMAGRVVGYYLNELRVEGMPSLEGLLCEVRQSYGQTTNGDLTEITRRGAKRGEPRGALTEAEALGLYQERCHALLRGHAFCIEGLLTQYCLNHLLVEAYADWPNLRAYVEDLALQVASARFLLFSHPVFLMPWDASSPGAGKPDDGECRSPRTIEHAAAEVFQWVRTACEQLPLVSELRCATGIRDAQGYPPLVALATI